MKKEIFISVSMAFLISISATVLSQLNPGISRWSIKTSIVANATHVTVNDINSILHLANPPGVTKGDDRYDKAIIPPFNNPLNLKEGDIVTTYGYIELVALENDPYKHRDGDYHIQVTKKSAWGDSCFVIEIPDDDPRFVSDPNLRNTFSQIRKFIRDSLLRGHEPSAGGNVMQHPPYMKITGQLFFDDEHVSGTLRGKNPNGITPKMKSYTAWEIHPVTSLSFAPLPHS